MTTFLGASGERIMYNIELTEGTARDIRAFSLFPSENELLLPPNFCNSCSGDVPPKGISRNSICNAMLPTGGLGVYSDTCDTVLGS